MKMELRCGSALHWSDGIAFVNPQLESLEQDICHALSLALPLAFEELHYTRSNIPVYPLLQLSHGLNGFNFQ
jgi:hypothetical protein